MTFYISMDAGYFVGAIFLVCLAAFFINFVNRYYRAHYSKE